MRAHACGRAAGGERTSIPRTVARWKNCSARFAAAWTVAWLLPPGALRITVGATTVLYVPQFTPRWQELQL